MRKPRDLAKYTDKHSAIRFMMAMLADVICEPDDICLRIKVSYSRWNPEWETKKAAKKASKK